MLMKKSCTNKHSTAITESCFIKGSLTENYPRFVKQAENLQRYSYYDCIEHLMPIKKHYIMCRLNYRTYTVRHILSREILKSLF